MGTDRERRPHPTWDCVDCSHEWWSHAQAGCQITGCVCTETNPYSLDRAVGAPPPPTPDGIEEIIGDELCRASFGDFSEGVMRRIARRISRRIEREAGASEQAAPPLDVERLIEAEKNTDGPAFPMSEFLPRLAATYDALGSAPSRSGEPE